MTIPAGGGESEALTLSGAPEDSVFVKVTRQIGEKLFISDVTVHHHLTSIYSKLEVADRMELLIYSYRNGLAEIPF